MIDCPYRTLMRYKRWATNGLNATLADKLSCLGEDDRHVILLVLDHIHVVDEIFRHNLEARHHGHSAPRSAECPSFEEVESNAAALGDWYVSYAGCLTSEKRDETVDFTFANGAHARITRGEMLLHVATHGTYHRGNIGIVLQKNGIAPPPDRMTDFLAAQGSH
jgi:uncharacterized damage-inducible protein DinB